MLVSKVLVNEEVLAGMLLVAVTRVGLMEKLKFLQDELLKD